MPPRILYVEDHDDTRIMMTFMLEKEGFEVISATNGLECLDLIKTQQFDLYLLNHTFPDISGVTLCMKIRETDKGTPILFYSARAMQEEKDAAIQAGAQDYLIKPSDIFNVAKHVHKWIEAGKSE